MRKKKKKRKEGEILVGAHVRGRRGKAGVRMQKKMNKEDKQKLEYGNCMLEKTVELVKMCLSNGVAFTIENPISSYLWQWPDLQKLLSIHDKLEWVKYDNCAYGRPYKKRTKILVSGDFLRPVAKNCSCTKQHVILSGWNKGQKNRKMAPTSPASVYPKELCKVWAKCIKDKFT